MRYPASHCEELHEKAINSASPSDSYYSACTPSGGRGAPRLIEVTGGPLLPRRWWGSDAIGSTVVGWCRFTGEWWPRSPPPMCWKSGDGWDSETVRKAVKIAALPTSKSMPNENKGYLQSFEVMFINVFGSDSIIRSQCLIESILDLHEKSLVSTRHLTGSWVAPTGSWRRICAWVGNKCICIIYNIGI